MQEQTEQPKSELPHSTSASSEDLPPAAAKTLVERLRDTPNWRRESWGSWKDCVSEYDRAPFEAAVEIERLLQVNRKMLGALHLVMQADQLASDAKDFARMSEVFLPVIRDAIGSLAEQS